MIFSDKFNENYWIEDAAGNVPKWDMNFFKNFISDKFVYFLKISLSVNRAISCEVWEQTLRD